MELKVSRFCACRSECSGNTRFENVHLSDSLMKLSYNIESYKERVSADGKEGIADMSKLKRYIDLRSQARKYRYSHLMVNGISF